MALKLFYRPTQEELELEDLVKRAVTLQERADLYQHSIAAMLHFLKAFTLDIKEINSDTFKNDIDALNQQFSSAEKPKRVGLHFERQKLKIVTFIASQNAYIQDREHELRDIIDLLTKAMANLDVENREFYQRVHDRSEKMEQITRLDDIKKMRSALQHEVAQMREIVDQKKDQDRRQVQLLSGQVVSLRQELEKATAKSLHDGLTGIYNRQAFDEALVEKIEHCHIMKENFSLLLLDLDDFKAINDTHGHLMGDRVLAAFAQKCRQAIRGDDFLARYGGEEFAIILAGANIRNAHSKARQICNSVSTARYAISDSHNEQYLSMTVSIGVSAFKKDDTVESLIGRTDKALYKAKSCGKNCAVARKS
jgi:diguanylate cyclase